MNPLLIAALGSLLPDGGLPDEIVYLPEGNHAITPFVDEMVTEEGMTEEGMTEEGMTEEGMTEEGMSPCMNRTLAPYAHQP